MAGAKHSHSGTISSRRFLPLLVAPTADGKVSNSIRQGLVPVGCFTVAAPGFDFDSSLLLPKMAKEFGKLGALLASLPEHPVSVFGHADPTGSDDYNKELAGRRALSVYGLLTKDPDVWEKLYASGSKAKGDHWTQRQLLVMLSALESAETGE
ncbi:MAG TPA: OmpA family protein, partial [Polyangiaceae bacterium]|nr:OmpA family protein [Polyangiaceae bacterium]